MQKLVLEIQEKWKLARKVELFFKGKKVEVIGLPFYNSENSEEFIKELKKIIKDI